MTRRNVGACPYCARQGLVLARDVRPSTFPLWLIPKHMAAGTRVPCEGIGRRWRIKPEPVTR